MDLLSAAVEWLRASCPPDKAYAFTSDVLFTECDEPWLREAWQRA